MLQSPFDLSLKEGCFLKMIIKLCMSVFMLAVIFLPRVFSDTTKTAGHYFFQNTDKSLTKILKSARIPEYQYQVINTYPHCRNRLADCSKRFTEGLFFQNGWLFESTGLYGKSRLLNLVKKENHNGISLQIF